MAETATMTDEQILGLDDSSSEVSSEIPEPSAAVETQVDETPQPDAETFPTPTKQPDRTQPADKTQPTAKPAADQGQDAAVYKELFPKGVEQAREVHAKAEVLDRTDAAFANGDYHGMAQVFQEVFSDNPHGCAEALWMGMRFLEERAPAELAGFSRIVVADELEKHGLHSFVENALKNPAQAHGALQKIADFLGRQYGMGPANPETQSSSWNGYVKAAGNLMSQTIDNDVTASLSADLAGVPPQLKQELLTAARIAVKDSLSKDRDVSAGFQKLQSGYNRNAGIKFYLDVLDRKLRSVVPRVVQSLKSEYRELFSKKPAASAPRTSQAAPAPVQAQPRNAAPSLGFSEASRMSDREILDSSKPVDLTRPDQRARTITRSAALKSRAPFAQLLDDALEVADQ